MPFSALRFWELKKNDGIVFAFMGIYMSFFISFNLLGLVVASLLRRLGGIFLLNSPEDRVLLIAYCGVNLAAVPDH